MKHRNAFVNIALPFFAFTPPLPPDELPGINGQTYTIWDRITMTGQRKGAGGSDELSLRRILQYVTRKAIRNPKAFRISSISYGEFLIYASFLSHDDDNTLDMDIWEVVENAISSGAEFDNESSIRLARRQCICWMKMCWT